MTVDPWIDDVLWVVFSKLDILTLIKCTQVCTDWRRCALGLSERWSKERKHLRSMLIGHWQSATPPQFDESLGEGVQQEDLLRLLEDNTGENQDFSKVTGAWSKLLGTLSKVCIVGSKRKMDDTLRFHDDYHSRRREISHMDMPSEQDDLPFDLPHIWTKAGSRLLRIHLWLVESSRLIKLIQVATVEKDMSVVEQFLVEGYPVLYLSASSRDQGEGVCVAPDDDMFDIRRISLLQLNQEEDAVWEEDWDLWWRAMKYRSPGDDDNCNHLFRVPVSRFNHNYGGNEFYGVVAYALSWLSTKPKSLGQPVTVYRDFPFNRRRCLAYKCLPYGCAIVHNKLVGLYSGVRELKSQTPPAAGRETHQYHAEWVRDVLYPEFVQHDSPIFELFGSKRYPLIDKKSGAVTTWIKSGVRFLGFGITTRPKYPGVLYQKLKVKFDADGQIVEIKSLKWVAREFNFPRVRFMFGPSTSQAKEVLVEYPPPERVPQA